MKNQGKDSVIIIDNNRRSKKTIPHGEIGMKFPGTLDHPIDRMILLSARQGEIT
jgi:hypothetical protein